MACIAVGRDPDPTGLEPTRQRTIKQLFWDVTAVELKDRLIELVADAGIDEEFLVNAILDYLESKYRRHADTESSENGRQETMRLPENMRQQRELPQSRRPMNGSDEEVDTFIAKLEGMIDKWEMTRRKNEGTLQKLLDER
ncbi:MAG TPA: hypothetical protein VG713_10425, partial [Pirellulales bacterium]|nr:hypothetical protein [Pirellulales bacterium]